MCFLVDIMYGGVYGRWLHTQSYKCVSLVVYNHLPYISCMVGCMEGGYIHSPINVSLLWISCMVGCMEGGYIHSPINVSL